MYFNDQIVNLRASYSSHCLYILPQAKEKLITSLRQGSDTGDIPQTLLSELEEAKQENEMFREEIQKYQYKNEQLRSEFLVGN